MVLWLAGSAEPAVRPGSTPRPASASGDERARTKGRRPGEGAEASPVARDPPPGETATGVSARVRHTVSPLPRSRQWLPSPQIRFPMVTSRKRPLAGVGRWLVVRWPKRHRSSALESVDVAVGRIEERCRVAVDRAGAAHRDGVERRCCWPQHSGERRLQPDGGRDRWFAQNRWGRDFMTDNRYSPTHEICGWDDVRYGGGGGEDLRPGGGIAPPRPIPDNNSAERNLERHGPRGERGLYRDRAVKHIRVDRDLDGPGALQRCDVGSESIEGTRRSRVDGAGGAGGR